MFFGNAGLSAALFSGVLNTLFTTLGSCNTFRNKAHLHKQDKWVKLAILHNKSKHLVQVSMVTVLRRTVWSLKVNRARWDKSDLIQVSAWCSEFASTPEMGSCLLRQLTPGYPRCYAARTQELLPFIWGAYAQAFLLLGSPAFICQWMLHDMRWQAAEALEHFRSKCPLSPFPLSFLLSSFFIWLSFFSFAHLAHPQTSEHTHLYTVCTSIVLSVLHTHACTSCTAIGSYAKVCVCVLNHLPWSQGADHSVKWKTVFLFFFTRSS